MVNEWKKDIYEWGEGDTGYMSIPFTWDLPKARARILNGHLFIRKWVVGGPAVELMPGYFDEIDNVSIGYSMNGMLQKMNPFATRTTIGCIRKCRFCGIGEGLIEKGGFRELEEWKDLPVICDNNLLACSDGHFERVIERLIQWERCDFNQGLDIRLLTAYRARRIGEIKKPIVRLSLDYDNLRAEWERAFELLRSAGIAKKNIKTYVLIGYNGDPEKDRERCEFVETHGVNAYPMWFHELNALKHNEVTEKQKRLGWTERKRISLFQWYYRHRIRN